MIRAIILSLALAGLAIGCDPRDAPLPPKPTPPPAKADVEAIQQDIAAQISKQLEKRHEDLEKQKLILLITGVRDDAQRKSIKDKAATLLGQKDNYSIVTKGAPGGCDYISISPIADVEATAGKIDFGEILAVDVEKRTIAINAAAAPTSRPADGWPGPKNLKQFVGRNMAGWAVEAANEHLRKKHGSEMVAVVAYPGYTSENAWADGVDARLNEFCKQSKTEITYSYTFAGQREFRVATLGPVKDLTQLLAILNKDIEWADEARRAVILEPQASDKPAD
jgi:hypothetical protein